MACRALACLIVLGVVGATAPAGADVVSIGAARDTTIYEEDASLSNGAGDHFFTGLTDNDWERRGLVAFDLSAIPAGSTITDVTLTLYMSRSKVASLDVSLHRVTSDWGEAGSHAGGEEGAGATADAGDATWSYTFFDTVSWMSTGGDYVVAPSSITSVGNNGSYNWTSTAMVSDVQGWLDSPSTNHGWVLIAGAATTKQTKRFDSRTNGTPSRRPVLTVIFTPQSATGACCHAGGSCTIVSAPGTSCTGDYQGNNSVCAPNPCPQPEGACCFADASATCTITGEGACTGASGTFQGGSTTCTPNPCPVVLTPFVDPLPKPAIAQPTSGSPGSTASYTLRIVQLTQKLHRDLPPTVVWGFDDGTTGGTYPGPTVEATTNQPITVTYVNDLRDGGQLRTDHYLAVDTCPHGADDSSPRTVVHLHGGHVAQASDGYPESTFLPGQQVVYQYPNWQDAATLWYHDHALGITRLNVYMGLAGFYVIRDATEAALDLPLGGYEIPIVIQDRTFAPDGSLVYPAVWQDHFFGDTIVVNGVVWPYLEVDRGKYRFRLLNGSSSRSYNLSLSNGATFWAIATDGGLIEAPVSLTQLTLAPGERAEVVIDFAPYSAGTELVLENDAPAPYPGSAGVGVIPHIMKFIVQSSAGHTNPLPATLRTITPIPQSSSVASRDFVLDKAFEPCSDGNAWFINGDTWDNITELPRLGTVEIWRFVNNSGIMHPMHMHLVFFQVLDRTPFAMIGGVPTATGSSVPPAEHEKGWKDTVQVGPGEMVRVIAKFEDFAGKYAYHCHILEHEDHEMMRQFQTVTTCGDGARGLPDEECDDGNTNDGDGCSSNCTIEAPDAGVLDASVPDASSSLPDATGPDAGAVASDAEQTDAGLGGADEGCGCRSNDDGSSEPLLWILVASMVTRSRLLRRASSPGRHCSD